ncbi:MAG TPA: pilus assembly protein TadG-related protein [Dehalococcoidia bacterium]|nr:pilus assembly protein TadG-related protein [Dehalococcoidia bacterium]
MNHLCGVLTDHLGAGRFWRGEGGNVALLFGLLMVPLMTGMGLVLDGGLLLFEYRGARNAADAAALAGAQKRHSNEDTGGAVPGALCSDWTVRSARTAVDASCNLAENHGYASEYIRVYVADGATSVPHSVVGASKQVEVVISRVYNTLLMRLVGIDQVPLAGVAVAGEFSAAVGAAVYALDPHACAGFDRTSTGGVYVFGGPIIVDSAASFGCNPAGGALDKTSGGVLCVDADRGDYPDGDLDLATPNYGYGCDGDGYISIVGGLDCNGDAECTTIKSEPDLDQGPAGGGPSGDPLSTLPGPDHRPCTGVDNCPGGVDPNDKPGHAFEFCDSADDPNGGIDSAILSSPLVGTYTDSRAIGLVTGCLSTSVLPTSPLVPRDISGNIIRGRYNVCSAPLGADGKHHVEPGIYWGGIYAGGGGCAEGVHFKHGIYIIAGQDSMSETNPKPSIDLNFSSGAGEVTSDDIIFFVTSDPEAIPSAQQTGLILFATEGTMTLRASTLSEASCPQNPNFEGVLLFVTRTAQRNESTAGGSDDNNLVRVHGGNFSNMTLYGIWYDPTGEFQAEGSFRLLDAQLIFNVLDMQNQNDVIIKLPACRARSNQLFLLR